MSQQWHELLQSVSNCRLCEDQLPHEPRPVFQLDLRARILIVGQAPGSRVHQSGKPFDDPSGDRLRDWMGVSRDSFYDAAQIALLPMGLCYPGRGKSGDLPPLAVCATTWRSVLLAPLKHIQLTLVIGQYAQAWHLQHAEKTLTDTVRAWQRYAPDIIPLPHPSPRNNIWLKKNPWFEQTVIPELKIRVAQVLS